MVIASKFLLPAIGSRSLDFAHFIELSTGQRFFTEGGGQPRSASMSTSTRLDDLVSSDILALNVHREDVLAGVLRRNTG